MNLRMDHYQRDSRAPRRVYKLQTAALHESVFLSLAFPARGRSTGLPLRNERTRGSRGGSQRAPTVRRETDKPPPNPNDQSIPQT